MKKLNSVLVLIFLILTFSCSNENEEIIQNIDSTNEEILKMNNMRPWIFIANPILSRETCMNGPGICFQNEDGDILIYGALTADMGDVIGGISGSNGTDVTGYQRDENQLNLIFSRSLGEDNLIITEDVILREDISRNLGAKKITIPAGEYTLNFENEGYVQSTVPIIVEEIQLDYHSQYGHIGTWDFQVGRTSNLDDFLNDLNLSENDLLEYNIIEENFTGITYVEHVINGETVYVWHEYDNEPITLFEAELTNGNHIISARILACGNMAQWEINLHNYILKKYAWFFNPLPCC